MKKLVCLGVAFTLLSACTQFDPDLDAAAEKRAENRGQIRSEIGCQFADDHDAYRRCLVSTYENNKPKTFVTSQDHSGQPVAVVSNGVSQGVVSPRSSSSETTTTTTTKTTTVMPGVMGGATAVSCGEVSTPCFYQTQDLYEMTVPVQAPCTTCQQYVVEPQVVTTVEKTETVVEKPVEVVPMPQPLPEKTWWETYQEEKKPAEEPKVVCPCPDPNDPCPQCVTK